MTALRRQFDHDELEALHFAVGVAAATCDWDLPGDDTRKARETGRQLRSLLPTFRDAAS